MPLLLEKGVAVKVATAIETNQMTKITFTDLEVIILHLYSSGLLILRYLSILMNVSV
jgi:hypothetical protein